MFYLGPLAVYTLGVALAAGFLMTAALAVPELRRHGIRRRVVLDMMFWLMLTSVVGARLVALATRWNDNGAGFRSLLVVPPDGLSYYGGLVVGILVVGWFAWQRDMTFWVLADAVTPPAALGFVTGLAVVLSTNMLQLQSAALPWANLIVFTLAYACTYLVWTWRLRKRFHGEVFLLFLAIDSLLRLVLGTLGLMSTGPYGSVRAPFVTLVITAVFWFVLRGAAHRRRDAVEPAPDNMLLRAAPIWYVGYVVFVALIVLRYRMGSV